MYLRPPRKRLTKVEVRAAPKKKPRSYTPRYPNPYLPKQGEKSRKKATAKARKSRQYGPTSSGSTTYKHYKVDGFPGTRVRHTDTKGNLRLQAADLEPRPKRKKKLPRREPSPTRRAGAKVMESGVSRPGKGYTSESISQIEESSLAGLLKLVRAGRPPTPAGSVARGVKARARARAIMAGDVEGVSARQIKLAQQALGKSKKQRTRAQRNAMKAIRRATLFRR